MKVRNFTFIIIITLFLSGCVVYSFYPLYTEKDLFPNDILTGEWHQSDDPKLKWNDIEATWKFVHPYIGKKENGILDSTSYYLVVSDKDSLISKFNVHVIKLGGHYFLDFYLDEFPPDDNIDLAAFHIIPVHTFAKLTVKDDMMIINWFDQDWLSELIRENKIRIHHEENDEFVLLTAKPKELQKFVTKYVNSEEAFEDGLEVFLHRK